MANEASKGLVYRLKGPALALLLVLGRDGGATRAQLSAATGWGRTAAYQALGRLAAAGWLERDRRGCWLLTEAGRQAWRELTGAPPPAMPQSNTGIHSAGRPRRDPAVPESGRKRRTAAHHDHDHDSDDDHDAISDSNSNTINNIIARLEALPDPFGGAARWAPRQDQRLLARWVEFLERAPEEWHSRFNSATAFMRTRVEAGLPPPSLPARRKQRRACTRCGHSVWDADGSCLVCAGVVKY